MFRPLEKKENKMGKKKYRAVLKKIPRGWGPGFLFFFTALVFFFAPPGNKF